MVKTIIWGHPHHAPLVLPQAARVVNTKQNLLPGGHEEIGCTILKREKAVVIRPAHSPYNFPVWPVKKSNSSWCMTVDYWELSEVTLPLHAVMLNVTYIMNRLSHELG